MDAGGAAERGRRNANLAVVAAIVLGLALGVALEPVRRDGGTQLRIGPFRVPEVCAFRKATGYPCATCGMTRSVVYALHGRIRESLGSHPFGIVAVALAVLGIVPRAAVAAGRGRRWVRSYDRGWLIAAVAAVLLMLAWWGLGLGRAWLSSGGPV